ncbi:hypothetical protein [Aquimarina rhabdastrellae]
MDKETVIVKEKLVGKFISRFSLGDTWELFIDDFCLSAHTIEFKEETMITKLIQEHYEAFNYSIDKEDISKATLMASNLRKMISAISLDEDKNLIIDFEKGSALKIATNTTIVDWQWYISKSGKDPYIDYDIACFWAGELKIKE